jgi:hypothetical protein
MRRFERQAEGFKYYLSTCSERTYPNLPTPPLLHTVPLKNHTGMYHDDGYGDLLIELGCNDGETSSTADQTCQLLVQRPEGSSFDAPVKIYLEHKSGDFWLAWIEEFNSGTPAVCLEVQFRVDVRGVVTHFGMNTYDGAPLTWFERV